MSGRSITNWLGLNRNLRSDGGDFRFLQLPRMNPFPKLDRDAVLATNAQRVAPRPATTTGTIIGGQGTLPEMMGDVIDVNTTYAESNVRRTEGRGRGGWGKAGLGLLMQRMTSGHPAARL